VPIPNISSKVITSLLKMLLPANLIKYTRLHLNIHRFLGTCSLKFETNQKLTVCSRKSVLWELKKTAVSILYFAIIWAQFFRARKENFATKLENFFFVTDFSVFIALKWMVASRQKEFAELFNLFLQFETNNLNGKGSF